MKTIHQFLFVLFALLLGNNLYAETALSQINDFVKSQKKITTAYDLEQQFKIMSTDPSFGPVSAASSNTTNTIGIAALDATHFVLTYKESGGQKAVIGQMNLNTISVVGYGTPTVFGDGGNIQVEALTPSKFVVVMENYLDVAGYVIVCERSGTNITTVGTQVTINCRVHRVGVKKLSSSKFVIAYQDISNSHHGTTIVGEVSGTTITLGSKVVFNTGITTVNGVFVIDANSFAVSYANFSGNMGQTRIGTVSGTTVTFGSPITFASNKPSNFGLFCSPLSATKFVLSWLDFSAGNVATVCIGEVSGGSITFGSPTVYNPNSSLTVGGTIGINATEFVAYYENAGGALVSKIGTVSGTSITFGNEVIIDYSGGESFSYATAISSSHFAIAYQAASSNNYLPMVVVGTNGAILPVELTAFTGQQVENAVKLSWQTASEINNDGFYIERSIDGQEWETIDFVLGNGTTLENSDYEYLDENPLENRSYYRLKQMDFDGAYEYSDIIEITIKQLNNQIIRVYPNPVTNVLNIENGEGTATIYNMLGQPIRTFLIPNSEFLINTTDLPKGQYVLKITKENRSMITKRFVK